MNTDVLASILDEYSIEGAMSFEKLPETTSGNDAYIIQLDDDKTYVAKTLVRQSKEGAESEYRIQKALRQAGVKVPLYLTTNRGVVVVEVNGNNYVLSEKLDGSRQAIDTLELAQDMGRALAKMHDTVSGLDITPNEQQWFRPKNALYQLELYDGPEKQYIQKVTQDLFALSEVGLPVTFTHGDFHTKNIFSADDKVTAIFDFESADYDLRIFDIARTYLTYRKSTSLNPNEILEYILRGYESIARTALSSAELNNLNKAIVYVALVSLVSIYNHGNHKSSAAYLDIAHTLERAPIILAS